MDDGKPRIETNLINRNRTSGMTDNRYSIVSSCPSPPATPLTLNSPFSPNQFVHHFSLTSPDMPQNIHDSLVIYTQDLWKDRFWNDNEFSANSNLLVAGYYKRWVAHHVVLRDSTLFCFRKENEPSPLIVLYLDQYSDISDASITSKVPNSISITVQSACSLELKKVQQSKTFIFSFEENENFQKLLSLLLSRFGESKNVDKKVEKTKLQRKRSLSFKQFVTRNTTVPISESESSPVPIAVPGSKNSLKSKSKLSTSLDERPISLPPSPKESKSSIKREHGEDLKSDKVEKSEVTPRPRMRSQRSMSRRKEQLQTMKEESEACSSVDGRITSFFNVNAKSTESNWLAHHGTFASTKSFLDCHRQVLETLDSIILFITVDNSFPMNYLEPCTQLIKYTRQMLYFSNGKFSKEMHNADFAGCLGKYMSIIIERIRTVGIEAKKLTEQEYLGIQNENAKQMLLEYLTQFVHDLDVFTNAAISLFELDGILNSKSMADNNQNFLFPDRLKINIMNNAVDLSRFVLDQDKIQYIESAFFIQSLLSSFASIFSAHHEEFFIGLSGLSDLPPPGCLSFDEFSNAPVKFSMLEETLDQTIATLTDSWHLPNASIYLAERTLVVATFMIQLINTLCYYEANVTDKWLITHFWQTYEMIVTPDEKEESLSVGNQSSAPNSPFFKPDEDCLENDATLSSNNFSTLPNAVNDFEVSLSASFSESRFYQNSLGSEFTPSSLGDRMKSPVKQTKENLAVITDLTFNKTKTMQSIVSPVSSLRSQLNIYKNSEHVKNHEVDQSSTKLKVNEMDDFSNRARALSILSDSPENQYAINEAIAKSIRQLSNMTLEGARNLRNHLKEDSDHDEITMRENANKNYKTEIINRYAMVICTAANQIEEEIGNLEENISQDASFISSSVISSSKSSFSAKSKSKSPGSLSSALEDSRKTLSRSLNFFETALKEYTNAFSRSCSSGEVIVNLECVEDAVREVTVAMNNVLSHQLFVVHGYTLKNPSASMTELRASSSSISIFTSTASRPIATRATSDLSGASGYIENKQQPSSNVQEPVEVDVEMEEAHRIVDEILEKEMLEFQTNNNILYRETEDSKESTIRGGSLSILVEQLTHHKLPSSDYTSAFLLTYLSFTTASELLNLLIERYKIKAPSTLTKKQVNLYKQKKIVPIRLRVFNVLKMWVKNNFEDFQSDPALLESLKDFLGHMKNDFSKGTKDFEKLIAKKETSVVEELTSSSNALPAPSPIVSKSFEKMTLESLDPLEIARQLTLIQWDIFQAINPNECLNQSWNVKALHAHAPHIRSMIKLSNYLVQWVATEIVLRSNAKARANVIKHFIFVADKLRKLNNFDGLNAVIMGINSSGIRRLKATWDLVQARHISLFEELVELMSGERSSKNYRTHLHSINPPCIPFIGIYLTDLTMIDSGNKNNLDALGRPDLINFHKRHLIAQVIQELKRYQCTCYNLIPVPEMNEWLLSRRAMEQEEIYEISLQAEPRDKPISDDSNMSNILQGSLRTRLMNTIKGTQK